MKRLPPILSVINEIVLLYHQMNDSNQDDIVIALIAIRDNLLERYDIISKKALLAKEQLVHYKCVLVENVYIIVPITQDGHRFDKFDRNMLFYNDLLSINTDDMSVHLWAVPYGPSEVLAWAAAYNKLVN